MPDRTDGKCKYTENHRGVPECSDPEQGLHPRTFIELEIPDDSVSFRVGSPSVGFRLILGRGNRRYLQNQVTEQYLFHDDNDQWFKLQPSAKDSEGTFIRWVCLPDDRPKRLARSALRRRTVIGYDYVRQSKHQIQSG